MDVSQPDWVVWIWRIFSSHQHSLTYLIHYPLWYQKDSVARLVKALAYRYWDLGSSPRSPHSFMYFFLTRFYAVCLQRLTMRLRLLACHVSLMIHLRAMVWSPGYTPVNTSTHKSGKSTWACISWARLLANKPPKGSTNPLVCISFLYSFPFYFCFNYFLLIP